MIANGVIASKWKSELTLFTLVHKAYPDTLFQYRPIWLEPQNLDIYVPSLNLGIEYQGLQHYQPVDYFGGIKAFERRQLLDQRKRELCKAHEVYLLEWPYTEDISIKRFMEKINDLHIG